MLVAMSPMALQLKKLTMSGLSCHPFFVTATEKRTVADPELINFNSGSLVRFPTIVTGLLISLPPLRLVGHCIVLLLLRLGQRFQQCRGILLTQPKSFAHWLL